MDLESDEFGDWDILGSDYKYELKIFDRIILSQIE
jgi:hypothetical protein